MKEANTHFEKLAQINLINKEETLCFLCPAKSLKQ